MSLFKTIRSKLYHNSAYLQYLWMRRKWNKLRKLAKTVSDRDYAREKYRRRTGKELNLDQPASFDEKLWWLKIHYREPLMTLCSDKYRVREYVRSCGLEHILNDMYGVWDDARQIDFDQLPSPCFLKCNHTSGVNILYDRKKPFHKKSFIRRFNFMLKQNYYWSGREWNYKDIDTKIVAEKVLENRDGTPLYDYRFMCFSGEPKFMMLDIDTCDEAGNHKPDAKRNIYDMDMNLLDVTFTRARHNIPFPITKDQFERMKEYAAALSKPFPFVRCDFYCIDGDIIFGELTFYHAGACSIITPTEFDLQLGAMIDIRNIDPETGLTRVGNSL